MVSLAMACVVNVLEMTGKFMDNPKRILISERILNYEPTLEGIKQFYVATEREEWALCVRSLRSSENHSSN